MKNNEEPKLPPLLISSANKGKQYYVMTYKNVWDEEKKRCKRANSTKIGKFDPNTGLITFDDTFLEKRPDLDGLLVYRTGTGRKTDYKFIKPGVGEDEPDLTLYKSRGAKTLHAGATYALSKIVALSPLGRALQKAFPYRNDAKKLLSLAYFLVIERDNALYNYSEFAECTYLPFQRPMESPEISRLVKRIKLEQVDKFFKYVNEEFDRDFKDKSEFKTKYLALDSTSISTYSKYLSDAEYGHNKDDDDLAQVNLMLITEQSHGFPLYYKKFCGCVPDISTIRSYIAESCRLGLPKDVVYVADRGYPSAKNIEDCLTNGLSFLFNMPATKLKSIQDEVDAVYNELLDVNNHVYHLNQTVVTREIPWKYDPYIVKGKRKQYKGKANLFLHFYYDEEIYKNNYSTIKANVINVRSKILEGKTLCAAEQAYVDQYMNVAEDGSVTIDMVKMNDACKYRGVRVLISDTVKDPIEAYNAYENRYQVELAFNTMKSRLKCNRFRVHRDDTLEGKVFLQVLATSISMMVRRKIYEFNQRKATDKALDKVKINVVHDSDNKLLRKLNNIFATSSQYGVLFDPIVGKRKDLLTILDVPLPGKEKTGEVDPDDEDITIDDVKPLEELL